GVRTAIIACRLTSYTVPSSCHGDAVRHCRSLPCGDSFWTSCTPTQSPAGRLLHLGFASPRGRVTALQEPALPAIDACAEASATYSPASGGTGGRLDCC